MFCCWWYFYCFGKTFAAYFDSDPAVIRAASLYLWIVSISLGLRSVHHIIWTALNVLGRPYDALILEFLLAFGLWIPLAFAGAHVAAIAGVFGGLSVANIVGGVTAYIWVDRVTAGLRRQRDQLKPAGDAASE